LRHSAGNDKNMNWQPYKNSPGEWTEYQGLVLTAWPAGSWSVHDPSFKLKPRSSDLIIRAVEGGIETGKREAEKAAKEMLGQT